MRNSSEGVDRAGFRSCRRCPATRPAPAKETQAMTKYLLSVHTVEGVENYTSDEDMQKAFAAVDKFNTKIQEQGIWVFGGGLEAADTATVVDGRGGDVVVTDGPF